ncbi:DUF924 family protein [Chthonobacter rhizosphaerae]|uniref:DUF924 family protein n=1 Tax=Chthonobacter rhizosphaerae TaxID=2735553 RepID=UPI0015EEC424|nr:DUF924 family protein [Chthonobacter rhizosphaerae]
MNDRAMDVLDFWWQAGPAEWFRADPGFDERCRDTLLALHEEAAAGALDGWQETPHGTLALLILLDQIPRNVFRGTPRAFATDDKALAIARRAMEEGFPRAYPKDVRVFFYLPFTHAEDMAAQEICVDMTRPLGMEVYHYALIHMDAIRRFGRFPHRNAILGRPSTPAEEAYLASGGFKG